MKESKNATQAPKRKRSKTNPKSEALSGDWKVLAASQNGQQATKQALAGMSVKFDSDQFILKMGSRKEVAMFELPETKSVQQINILSGRQDMQESKGILKLKDDLLIICWGDPGSPRPTQFKNLMNVKSLVLERK
jgi:uncharacterized protein (TIGR03067 family)